MLCSSSVLLIPDIEVPVDIPVVEPIAPFPPEDDATAFWSVTVPAKAKADDAVEVSCASLAVPLANLRSGPAVTAVEQVARSSTWRRDSSILKASIPARPP